MQKGAKADILKNTVLRNSKPAESPLQLFTWGSDTLTFLFWVGALWQRGNGFMGGLGKPPDAGRPVRQLWQSYRQEAKRIPKGRLVGHEAR